MGSTRPSESSAKMHGAAPNELLGRDLEVQKKSLGAHGVARTSPKAMELGVYRRDTEPFYHHQPDLKSLH